MSRANESGFVSIPIQRIHVENDQKFNEAKSERIIPIHVEVDTVSSISPLVNTPQRREYSDDFWITSDPLIKKPPTRPSTQPLPRYLQN